MSVNDDLWSKFNFQNICWLVRVWHRLSAVSDFKRNTTVLPYLGLSWGKKQGNGSNCIMRISKFAFLFMYCWGDEHEDEIGRASDTCEGK